MVRNSEFAIILGRALDLDLNVHGAPNFRAPRHSNLNVFGVAQPRTQGLRGILSVLRCRPNTPNPTHVVWFCTREEPIGALRSIRVWLAIRQELYAEGAVGTMEEVMWLVWCDVLLLLPFGRVGLIPLLTLNVFILYKCTYLVAHLFFETLLSLEEL